MSFNTKLVVVGFTLALLVASYNVAAVCEDSTRIMCTSDARCQSICLQKKGYTGGYCSTVYVVDGHASCVCRKTCGPAAVGGAGE
ncbi:hypothetical protein HU200_063674 [Digitaria exilis]|uniref:Defensin n=1 Tax=Digitaria exilis TaxID=1010633 RepID=A0A835A2R2_9POAL|nr:hypothetical protein HU200_063674 [Digitaria exilis]CAB3490034.1 unnamed protein product [Digitaria exilis]CAB3490049.1 unnamed protein product [Digitaria exilis]